MRLHLWKHACGAVAILLSQLRSSDPGGERTCVRALLVRGASLKLPVASTRDAVPTTPAPTTTGEWVCPENTSCADPPLCYGPERRCDGETLCADGSDERGCPCHFNETVFEVRTGSGSWVVVGGDPGRTETSPTQRTQGRGGREPGVD